MSLERTLVLSTNYSAKSIHVMIFLPIWANWAILKQEICFKKKKWKHFYDKANYDLEQDILEQNHSK